MIWTLSHRADPKARDIADRHYNRQSIGATCFTPPGRCLVLYAENDKGKALWVTSYPFAQYVKHAWAGAWICSAFRNEGLGLASELIIQAVCATKSYYGNPPDLGMITFIDTTKVKPIKIRGKESWGYVFTKAGFKFVGKTKKGLLTFQLLPNQMPDPIPPKPRLNMYGFFNEDYK